MVQSTPPSCVFQRRITDVDDLAEQTRGWDLDFRQLECGTFDAEVLQFSAGGVYISDARFGRKLNQKGAPPSGMRTIAVIADPKIRFVWRGQHVDGNSLLIFPPGAELSSVSGPDFHVYTCSFPEHLLAAASATLQVPELDGLRNKLDAVRCIPDAVANVRSCLVDLCQSARHEARALSNMSIIDRLARDLPQCLIRAIANSTEGCPSATSPKRDAALMRAEAFIQQFAQQDITVGEISQAAGVSQRTLEYAFVERFGIAPKEFLTVFRLCGVRRQLRSANPKKDKVADAANRWGFWHMGQFAADYHSRFDELPSETLRRGQA